MGGVGVVDYLAFVVGVDMGGLGGDLHLSGCLVR